MGLKYLLLIGAIAAIVFLMRKARHRRLERDRRQARSRTQPTRMQRCAHCGLHIPEGEAVQRGEDYFCCREHADLGKF